MRAYKKKRKHIKHGKNSRCFIAFLLTDVGLLFKYLDLWIWNCPIYKRRFIQKHALTKLLSLT